MKTQCFFCHLVFVQGKKFMSCQHPDCLTASSGFHVCFDCFVNSVSVASVPNTSNYKHKSEHQMVLNSAIGDGLEDQRESNKNERIRPKTSVKTAHFSRFSKTEIENAVSSRSSPMQIQQNKKPKIRKSKTTNKRLPRSRFVDDEADAEEQEEEQEEGDDGYDDEYITDNDSRETDTSLDGFIVNDEEEIALEEEDARNREREWRANRRLKRNALRKQAWMGDGQHATEKEEDKTPEEEIGDSKSELQTTAKTNDEETIEASEDTEELQELIDSAQDFIHDRKPKFENGRKRIFRKIIDDDNDDDVDDNGDQQENGCENFQFESNTNKDNQERGTILKKPKRKPCNNARKKAQYSSYSDSSDSDSSSSSSSSSSESSNTFKKRKRLRSNKRQKKTAKSNQRNISKHASISRSSSSSSSSSSDSSSSSSSSDTLSDSSAKSRHKITRRKQQPKPQKSRKPKQIHPPKSTLSTETYTLQKWFKSAKDTGTVDQSPAQTAI